MIRPLSNAVIESVSKTIAETMSGTDISRILNAMRVVDSSGVSTKWRRIDAIFTTLQNGERCANKFGEFIERAADPARWSGRNEAFKAFRDEINTTLLLAGMHLGADGKLGAVEAARTLDESAQRINRLRADLQARHVHERALRFSSKLVIRDANYFHAVFEATKSIFDRLREISNSAADGNRLIDETLEKGTRPFPLIALNRFDSESLQNEQKGVAYLARGLVHAFRNVTAHAPAVDFVITEADALDMMSTASLIHRRLDNAISTASYQRHQV